MHVQSQQEMCLRRKPDNEWIYLIKCSVFIGKLMAYSIISIDWWIAIINKSLQWITFVHRKWSFKKSCWCARYLWQLYVECTICNDAEESSTKWRLSLMFKESKTHEWDLHSQHSGKFYQICDINAIEIVVAMAGCHAVNPYRYSTALINYI